MEDNHHYTTSDTPLATYLICEGFTLTDINYDKPRYEFVFADDADQIPPFASKYISGKALVDPATFTRVNRKLLRCVKEKLQWWD